VFLRVPSRVLHSEGALKILKDCGYTVERSTLLLVAVYTSWRPTGLMTAAVQALSNVCKTAVPQPSSSSTTLHWTIILFSHLFSKSPLSLQINLSNHCIINHLAVPRPHSPHHSPSRCQRRPRFSRSPQQCQRLRRLYL
jgi:hypothetical protein